MDLFLLWLRLCRTTFFRRIFGLKRLERFEQLERLELNSCSLARSDKTAWHSLAAPPFCPRRLGALPRLPRFRAKYRRPRSRGENRWQIKNVDCRHAGSGTAVLFHSPRIQHKSDRFLNNRSGVDPTMDLCIFRAGQVPNDRRASDRVDPSKKSPSLPHLPENRRATARIDPARRGKPFQ